MNPLAARDTARRAAAFAAACAVYFLHAPLAYVGALRYHPALPALVLALAVGVAFAGVRLRGRYPRAVTALAALYYLGVSAGLAIPLYFLFLLGPWIFPVPVLAGCLAAAVRGRAMRVRALMAVVAATAALAQAATIGPLPAALIALLVLGWGVPYVAGRPASLSRPALAFGLVGLLVGVRLVTFLSGVPAGESARVSAQPGVEIIVAPEDLADPRSTTLRPPEVRFAVESCDGREWYVGTRGEHTGLFAVDKETGARRFLPMEGDVSDNLAADCARGVIYVGCYGCGKAYEVDEADLTVRREIDKPGVEVGIFRLPADGEVLYMIPDATSDLTLIDTRTFTEIGTKGYLQWNSAMILDDARGRIVKMTNAGGVVLYDRHTMEILREKRLDGRLYFNVVLADRRGELLVGNMASGRLFALDRDTLATVRKGRHRRGIRFMAYDERRDVLYVANFFDGTLSALDPETFAERARIRVGPRPRWVELAEGGDSLLVASGVGAVRVRLPLLLGERAED